jgi:putative drug exporter of the RND superfamily
VAERWTKAVLRYRFPVLAVWLAALVAGVAAGNALPSHLSNVFTVPGTESDTARQLLQQHFGERPDGVFTVVFRAPRSALPAAQRQLNSAAKVVPESHASKLRSDGGILYGEIDSTLDLQHAKGYTDDVRRALPDAYITGQPAIQHDLEPVLSHDLVRGEAIALPIALVVLLVVLGVSLAVLVPFAFAACTIAATLGIVYLLAHGLTMVSYVSNLVELVGLGLAIDYSLLIIYRFREELRDDDVDGAIVRTMATAGRSVLFSGAVVAIGLALLIFVPVPFVRSLGIGGFLVPVVSVGAAATLQPALLSALGVRGMRRIEILPAARDLDRGFWSRLARAIMRRPVLFLAVGSAALLAAAVPALWLAVTPGSISALPKEMPAVRGIDLLRDRAGSGALTPIEIVIDTGQGPGVRTPEYNRALHRLTNSIFHDREAYITASGHLPPYVDAGSQYGRVFVVARHEYGAAESRALVERIRDRHIPFAGFRPGTHVYVGGAPAQGADYLSRSYAWFPWLVVAALVLTYLVLLRAFRSVLLPLKAVILNILSVAAVYGLLVVTFRWGVGARLLGLYQVDQIEGWIPIFLFAMLFGLSMDYEVFLVTRMREAWDELHENSRAVAYGLERTGRIITAAALIMVVAFSGFVAGRVAGLQEFGVGLALAIFIDVTIVRMILVPSLMAIFGRWNWWLPGRESRGSPSPSTRST